jgi:hypothetical protein
MASSQLEASPVRDAYTCLTRASSLAHRPGIVILDQDLPALGELTSSKAQSHNFIVAPNGKNVYLATLNQCSHAVARRAHT